MDELPNFFNVVTSDLGGQLIMYGKSIEDILFASSSAAADFVLGYSVSGPATWKDKNGISLKEIERKV